jgi:hypothetical protein
MSRHRYTSPPRLWTPKQRNRRCVRHGVVGPAEVTNAALETGGVVVGERVEITGERVEITAEVEAAKKASTATIAA